MCVGGIFRASRKRAALPYKHTHTYEFMYMRACSEKRSYFPLKVRSPTFLSLWRVSRNAQPTNQSSAQLRHQPPCVTSSPSDRVPLTFLVSVSLRTSYGVTSERMSLLPYQSWRMLLQTQCLLATSQSVPLKVM